MRAHHTQMQFLFPRDVCLCIFFLKKRNTVYTVTSDNKGPSRWPMSPQFWSSHRSLPASWKLNTPNSCKAPGEGERKTTAVSAGRTGKLEAAQVMRMARESLSGSPVLT